MFTLDDLQKKRTEQLDNWHKMVQEVGRLQGEAQMANARLEQAQMASNSIGATIQYLDTMIEELTPKQESE